MSSDVTIYTKPNDPWSKKATALLASKNITYSENIVTENSAHASRLASHQSVVSKEHADTVAPGWKAKPVTIINGETVVGLKALRAKLGA